MGSLKKIVICVGREKMVFSVTETDGTSTEHIYMLNKKMSVAANLREVFKEQSYMKAAKMTEEGIPCIHATLIVETPVVLVPIEETFEPDSAYDIAIKGFENDEKIVKEIDLLDAIAIFPVNRDLKMVVTDNCSEVEVGNHIIPVWQNLYKKYFTGTQNRNLFVYFNDSVMYVCYFEHHRFRYANSFNVTKIEDIMYFVLYIWKQLGMNPEKDTLSLCGEIPEGLTDQLKKYVKEVKECAL